MKLGILGGGQLGRMMMPILRELNVKHSVLDPAADCPCHNVADEHILGDFNDYQTVLDFGKTVDILTIEIEQVNVAALKELVATGKKVWPSPNMIEIIQNKHEQKKFFVANNIPTSAFKYLNDPTKIKAHLDFLPFAQKATTGGYDGHGVMLHRNEKKLNQALPTDSIIEKLVAIDQELSVIVARNENGEIKTFPTVGQTFDEQANLVKFVYAPADISTKVDQQCQQLAIKLAKKFQLVGLLAVEFFLSTSGEVLVNEVAPRCHNSGHWTQNGCTTSQFEQLIRAVTNKPLGATNITKPTVMINILGEPNYVGVPKNNFIDPILAMAETHIHLYGKTISKPLRKMGHINVSANTLAAATEKAAHIYTILGNPSLQ